jgi:hypothetical protein
MRRVTGAVGLIAVALALAGCRPAPEAEAPAPTIAPVASPAPSTPEALRRAAAQVLSADCGLSVCDPGYPEHAQLLKDAGPAVVPVLTEMVGDRHLSAWFVSRAAHWAARYPLDERFRQALRGRRDDPEFGHDHGARLGVFRYFVAFGDESDLAWMERAAETLDATRRPIGDEEIRKLRARLLRS